VLQVPCCNAHKPLSHSESRKSWLKPLQRILWRAGHDAPPAKTEWAAHELPWYWANMHIGSPSLRLHNEIVELTQLLKPTEQEDVQRMEAHKLLSDVVQEVFPGSKLDIFGSFATSLHLPTSDVDCVILDAGIGESQVPTALQGLGRKLQQKDWVRDLEVRAVQQPPSPLCCTRSDAEHDAKHLPGMPLCTIRAHQFATALLLQTPPASAGRAARQGADRQARHHAVRPQV
jgi:predicted nucleotidyltransferase